MRAAAAERDQLRQAAVAGAVGGEEQQPGAFGEGDRGADDELELEVLLADFEVDADDAG